MIEMVAVLVIGWAVMAGLYLHEVARRQRETARLRRVLAVLEEEVARSRRQPAKVIPMDRRWS